MRPGTVSIILHGFPHLIRKNVRLDAWDEIRNILYMLHHLKGLACFYGRVMRATMAEAEKYDGAIVVLFLVGKKFLLLA